MQGKDHLLEKSNIVQFEKIQKFETFFTNSRFLVIDDDLFALYLLKIVAFNSQYYIYIDHVHIGITIL